MNVRKWILSVVLTAMVLMSGCAAQQPSRWAAIQEASQGQSATAAEALAGGEFNKFFPTDVEGYDVVYIQEKVGFAEAVVKENGMDVATLSIFDTVSNPDAVTKYSESSEEIAGYPAVAVGENGTDILVADRFQVQVRSEINEFDEQDRADWLQKFDLDGLAQLAE